MNSPNDNQHEPEMSDTERITSAHVADVRHLLQFSMISRDTLRELHVRSVQRRVLDHLEGKAQPSTDEQQAVPILRRLLGRKPTATAPVDRQVLSRARWHDKAGMSYLIGARRDGGELYATIDLSDQFDYAVLTSAPWCKPRATGS